MSVAEVDLELALVVRVIAAELAGLAAVLAVELDLAVGTQPDFGESIWPLKVAAPFSTLYLNFVNVVGYSVSPAAAANAVDVRTTLSRSQSGTGRAPSNGASATPGGRYGGRCVGRPFSFRSSLAPPRGHRAAVSIACSSCASSAESKPDLDRSSGLMKPSLIRNPPARAIASRSGTAQWCSISSSAAAESLGMSSRTSQASSSVNTCDALGGRLRTGDRAGLHALLALDPEADQRADLAAELDRLVLGEVAEVLHLDLALGVLVDGERVDHPHRVALAQPLELGDDLAVEVRVLEAQHQELNRSDCHLVPFPRSTLAPLSIAMQAHPRIIRSG